MLANGDRRLTPKLATVPAWWAATLDDLGMPRTAAWVCQTPGLWGCHAMTPRLMRLAVAS